MSTHARVQTASAPGDPRTSLGEPASARSAKPVHEPIATLDTARRAQLAWTLYSLPQRLEIVRKGRESLVARAEKLAQTAAEIRRCPVTEALVSEVIPLEIGRAHV